MKKHFENKKFIMASEASGYELKEILKKNTEIRVMK